MGAVSSGIDPITGKPVWDRLEQAARRFIDGYDEWLMTMNITYGERILELTPSDDAFAFIQHAVRCGHIKDQRLTQEARDYLSKK